MRETTGTKVHFALQGTARLRPSFHGRTANYTCHAAEKGPGGPKWQIETRAYLRPRARPSRGGTEARVVSRGAPSLHLTCKPAHAPWGVAVLLPCGKEATPEPSFALHMSPVMTTLGAIHAPHQRQRPTALGGVLPGDFARFLEVT